MMLWIRKWCNSWEMRIIFNGFVVFLISFQLIKSVQVAEVRKSTALESRRLITLVSARLMHNITDIASLYSQVNYQNYQTYQGFVNHLNDYFKRINALESVTFYAPDAAGKETLFYNPYTLKGVEVVSKIECDAMLKEHPEKKRHYRSMLIIPVLDHLCLYNTSHFVLSILNVRSSLRDALNAEIKKGYFLTFIDKDPLNKTSQSPFAEVHVPFSFYGTAWSFRLYPSHAYLELYLKNAYLFSSLFFCLFLFVFLMIDRLRNDKLKKSKFVESSEVGYLRQLTLYDQLTHLPNRDYFLDYLDTVISRANRSQSNFYVCYMDCDHFKMINDTYGHHVGDQVLQYVGRVVPKKIRKHDFFARLSGDEFCLILETIPSQEVLHLVIDKLLKALAQGHRFEGHDISVSMSVGVAMYPEHGTTAEGLLIYADKAMYREKKRKLALTKV
ncbi:MAG: diguanylate cyclase domain-containing protein [Legionellaceae bacterium]